MKVLVCLDSDGFVQSAVLLPIKPHGDDVSLLADIINCGAERGFELRIVDGPVTIRAKLPDEPRAVDPVLRARIASHQMVAWLPTMIDYVDDQKADADERDSIAARMAAEMAVVSADCLLAELTEKGGAGRAGFRPPQDIGEA